MPTAKQSPVLIDAYSAFDYRTNLIANASNNGKSWMAPTWVGEHTRRLHVYTVLDGYLKNAARSFMEITGGGDERQAQIDAKNRRREYGDAALLISTALASLLGDQQQIVVELADLYSDAEGAENKPEVIAANKRQDELRAISKKDRFITKMFQTERNGVGKGDGVYSLYWSSKKNRYVTLPWDPGFYFPVLSGVEQGDYPTRVHLAWELTDEDAEAKYGERMTVIHRITFEMLDVEPYKVPWETELQTQRCFMWEAEYKTFDGVRGPDDLSDEHAIWMLDADGQEIREKDLGIDFVPVVHIPNTVAESEHYGQSVLGNVLQLIDDIQSVDSDAQFSSDLTGNPILVVKGSVASKLGVAPGTVISVSKDGDAFFLAASEFVQALREQANELRDLLGINSRITSAAQGRIDPTKIAAGIILQLQFGPLKTFVNEMRLVREDKYGLLTKFQQRLMILNGVWEGDVLESNVVFGSFLPNDVTAVINECAVAVAAGFMSLETAIRRMIEVGVPIRDVAEEIQNINKRNFEGAAALELATNNPQAVEDFLGIKVEKPEAPEVIDPLADPDDAPNSNIPPD